MYGFELVHYILMSRTILVRLGLSLLVIGILTGIAFSLPTLLARSIAYERAQSFALMQQAFPVTVDPLSKRIVEDPHVNAFLESPASPLQAAAGNLGEVVHTIFTWLAVSIADLPLYQSLAASDGRLVNITPGMRKEQVAATFAKVLGWSNEEKKQFLTTTPYASLPLSEGSYLPGVYVIERGATPLRAQELVNERFTENILSHYSTTTARIVPLIQALTIASLIEREAGGGDDMRMISGIIWNRLFINMNLQIDATLQYAKANTRATDYWWPQIMPGDQFRKSPYNTYLHAGLPPTPIANPSVASVLAALNPKNTSCLFYFHDASSGFHCSTTYAEHVALLKQYYGRGK